MLTVTDSSRSRSLLFVDVIGAFVSNMPGNSEKDQHPTSAAMSTRRKKRKGDDLEKASPTASRKRRGEVSDKVRPSASKRRSSGSSQKPSRPSAPRSSNKSAKAAQCSPIAQLSNMKPSITEPDLSAMRRLLSRGNLDDNLRSALQSQLGEQHLADVPSDDEPNTAVDDEEQGEFQKDNADDRDSDDDHLSDEDDDALEPQNEKENTINADNLGRSDDEQEVSFNAGHKIDEENRDDDEVQQDPFATSGTIASPAQPSGNPQVGNEGPLPHAHDRVDESVLVNFLNVFKGTITANMEASFNHLLSEIKSDREQNKKLRQHVSELTAIITTTATSMFIKQAATKPRVKELHNKLCLLPALFNDSFLLKVLPKVVVGFIATNILDGSSTAALELKGVDMYSLLFFSVQPHDTKRNKFSTRTGHVYSKFRYGFLMTAFLAMQSNTFRTFRADPLLFGEGGSVTAGEEETSTVSPRVPAMLRPFWLKPGYVLSEHCAEATKKQERKSAESGDENADTASIADTSQGPCDSESTEMQESSNSSCRQKQNRTGPLTRDEIATEAATLLYKTITSMLTKSRNAFKSQLFHDLSYLFVSWEQHCTLVCQKTMSIKWETSFDRTKDYTECIPRTKAARPQDHQSIIGHEMDRNDLDNVEHLQSLISKHPELSLLVEHDVKVNATTERIAFRVSLIEVACKALAAYVTLESAAKVKNALSADKRSLKVVMVLALALRKLIEKGVADLNTNNEIPWIHNIVPKRARGRPRINRDHIPPSPTSGRRYTFETVNGLGLSKLFPAPSRQKDALNQMILNLTQEEFNTKAQRPNGIGNVDDSEGIGGVGGEEARIQADETQGVFGF